MSDTTLEELKKQGRIIPWRKDDDRVFLPLSPWFRTQLTGVLKPTGRFLDIPQDRGAELCHTLGRDCYTYLSIGDECNWELIRVQVEQGRLYISDRGLEGTVCREWPCGTCVEFHPTTAVMLDLIENAYRYRRDKDNDDKDDTDEQGINFTGVLCVGIWDYHVKEGVIVACKRSKRNIPTSTVTRNTTICWDKDGCIEQAGGGGKMLTQINCDK